MNKALQYLQKFKTWQQLLISIITGLIFLSPIIGTQSKKILTNRRSIKSIPALEARIDSIEARHEREMLELVDTLKAEITVLREAINVLYGMMSSNMYKVDTLHYYTRWEDNPVEVFLRISWQNDVYVFVPDWRVGERGFKVDINKDKGLYTFTDFNGRYTFIYPEGYYLPPK